MSGGGRNESEKSVNDSGFKRFAFEHGVTWFPEDPVDLDAVQETDKTQIYNLETAWCRARDGQSPTCDPEAASEKCVRGAEL